MAGRNLSDKEQRAWARVVKSVKPMGDRAITFDLPQDVESEGGRDVADTGRDLGEVPHPNRPRKAKAHASVTARRETSAPADRGREKKVRRGSNQHSLPHWTCMAIRRLRQQPRSRAFSPASGVRVRAASLSLRARASSGKAFSVAASWTGLPQLMPARSSPATRKLTNATAAAVRFMCSCGEKTSSAPPFLPVRSCPGVRTVPRRPRPAICRAHAGQRTSDRGDR